MRAFSLRNAVLWLILALASGCGFASDDGGRSESARSWTGPPPSGDWTGATPVPDSPDEPRLRNLRQLTHGGTDGANQQQITDNGASNFAPFPHPNGRQIIFSSNLHSPGGRSFALYMVDLDGGGPDRITASDEEFDGFPMFSPDGRYLAFASSRGAESPGEINVFLAEWSPENTDQ